MSIISPTKGYITLNRQYLQMSREVITKHEMASPVDELIRFSRSWGLRSRSYKVILEKFSNKISPKGVQGSPYRNIGFVTMGCCLYAGSLLQKCS